MYIHIYIYVYIYIYMDWFSAWVPWAWHEGHPSNPVQRRNSVSVPGTASVPHRALDGEIETPEMSSSWGTRGNGVHCVHYMHVVLHSVKYIFLYNIYIYIYIYIGNTAIHTYTVYTYIYIWARLPVSQSPPPNGMVPHAPGGGQGLHYHFYHCYYYYYSYYSATPTTPRAPPTTTNPAATTAAAAAATAAAAKTTTIYYYILLYTTIYYYILLYTTIYYYILLYTTIHYYILLYTTIYYYILLYTTIYYVYLYFHNRNLGNCPYTMDMLVLRVFTHMFHRHANHGSRLSANRLESQKERSLVSRS